jgi:hypothetical protein
MDGTELHNSMPSLTLTPSRLKITKTQAKIKLVLEEIGYRFVIFVLFF